MPRFDRNSILCKDGSFSGHYEMKYTHDDITGIWFWKAEESLRSFKMRKKNIKAADIRARKSSADVGSKE